MKLLRFCFPTTFYPPFSFGGDAIAVQRLARALVSRGHRVTVVHDVDAYAALSEKKQPTVESVDDGIEVISLRSGVGSVSALLAQQTGTPTIHRSRLRRFFDDRAFDVVNFHNVSLIGGPGIFGLAENSARIYSAHEHWLVCPTHVLWRHKKEPCPARECIRCQLRYRRPPQLWRYTGHLEENFSRIDAYIAMSEFSRAKHAEFGFKHQMHVIPPFVESPESTGHDAEMQSRPYFFFAGRLEEIKGLQSVLPIMSKFPEADLLVAGEGSYRRDLELGAGPNVKFLGRVKESDLPAYYSSAIATIVPSITFETFGLTLIESFAAGAPVIARNLGPFPEIVSQSSGGVLFSDDTELENAMRQLAEDPVLRARLAANGQAAHRALWSEDAVIPQYLSLAQSVIEARR